VQFLGGRQFRLGPLEFEAGVLDLQADLGGVEHDEDVALLDELPFLHELHDGAAALDQAHHVDVVDGLELTVLVDLDGELGRDDGVELGPLQRGGASVAEARDAPVAGHGQPRYDDGGRDPDEPAGRAGGGVRGDGGDKSHAGSPAW
jgi:hypothetical protein